MGFGDLGTNPEEQTTKPRDFTTKLRFNNQTQRIQPTFHSAVRMKCSTTTMSFLNGWGWVDEFYPFHWMRFLPFFEATPQMFVKFYFTFGADFTNLSRGNYTNWWGKGPGNPFNMPLKIQVLETSVICLHKCKSWFPMGISFCRDPFVLIFRCHCHVSF